MLLHGSTIMHMLTDCMIIWITGKCVPTGCQSNRWMCINDMWKGVPSFCSVHGMKVRGSCHASSLVKRPRYIMILRAKGSSVEKHIVTTAQKMSHSTTCKVLLILFWDCMEPHFICFMECGVMTNSSTYFHVLPNHRKLRFKTNGMEGQGRCSPLAQQCKAAQCMDNYWKCAWTELWNLTRSTLQSWLCTK